MHTQLQRWTGWMAAVLLASFSVTAAADFEWMEPGGGSLGDPVNWDPDTGVPGSGEAGLFNLDEDPAYVVTLDQERTGANAVGRLQVMNDRVVLDLNGYDFELDVEASGDYTDLGNNDDFAGTSSLMVGRGGGSGDHHNSTFVLRNTGAQEATLTVDSFLLGGTLNSTGHFVVEGENTSFVVTSNTHNHSVIGIRGTGHMTVRDGADVTLEVLRLSRRLKSNQLIVEDPGTTMTVKGRTEISYRSAGDLIHVRNGAHLTLQLLYLAGWTGTGTMTVENATAESTSNIEIGRTYEVGTLNVIAGGGFTVSGRVDTGVMSRADSTTDSGGIINVGGAGSLLDVGTYLSLGADGTTDKGSVGDLNVGDGGAVDVGTYLYLGSASNVNIDGGTVEVAQNLAANEGASYTLTLHTGEFDAPLTQTSAAHAVTLDDMTFTLELAPDFDAAENDVFGVLGYAGDLDGTFLDLADGATLSDPSGYEFQLAYGDGSDDAITLTVTQIPEPGTLALLIGAGVLLAVRRRRG